MIISVLNQKGGVGKTTLAIHLARTMPLIFPSGKGALLVDADPQGSTRDWNARSEGQYVHTIGLDRPSINQDIMPHVCHYDWTIIDGPSGINPLPHSIIKCSDVILIPIKPSQVDLDAVEELLDLIQARNDLTGKPRFSLIINQQIKYTICSRDIKSALVSAKIPFFNSGTTNRVSYSTSIGKGKTVLETADHVAREEITAICQELLEFIK